MILLRTVFCSALTYDFVEGWVVYLTLLKSPYRSGLAFFGFEVGGLVIRVRVGEIGGVDSSTILN